ncbi:F-box/LRR-repeat protein 13-like [Chenopodium quinoa]|uniref:F-box/LRR-repeat protein 13-like n=1 Tax=Chenopodium quinoa TaxID=63459 RepID=UPI000B76CE66|nr:F-box/LRR-repeat protein 13-like [Chenopodium quinoa]
MSDISYPVGETDYISSLHDTILCHILSFLPTKSAVKTCVLSKRWKKVWNQVPVLDFTEIPDDYHPLCNGAKISYNKFVNKVLAENNAFYLKRFCYEFSCDDDCDYYESWLNAAKQRECYEIDLNFTLGESRSYKFMEMMYGKGVKILKITGVKMNDTPESFHLPSLEIVHFVKVEFNGSEYMKRFTSNCAALKTIIIKECTGFADMLLPLLTEANLHLRENFPVMVSEYGGDYDIYQNINSLICKASKIRSLRLKTSGLFLNGRQLPTFGNLTQLAVKAESCTYELLRKTPNLKSLIYEEVEWIDTSLNCIAEEGCLSNLKHVTIFLDNVCQVHIVTCILKAATNLEKLTINLCCPKISESRIRRELSAILIPTSSMRIEEKTITLCCSTFSERRTQQFPVILTPSPFLSITVIFTKSTMGP